VRHFRRNASSFTQRDFANRVTSAGDNLRWLLRAIARLGIVAAFCLSRTAPAQ